MEEGAVAALAEERKVAKYVNLTPEHLFSPIVVETMGEPQGPRSPGDPDNRGGGSYHLPCPDTVSGSAAGNCASVMGTTGQLDSGLFF